nr:NUDIX domain-containing protein [uncultured Duganella sp.]
MKQRMLSAGVVVLHQRADGCRYLLLRCYRNWDFPKGLVEPGETPFAAACREVGEETSLTTLAFPWGRQYTATAPYGPGKVARYYLALSASDDVRLPASTRLGRPEHHAFSWLPYAAARRVLGPRLLPVLDWAQALSGC